MPTVFLSGANRGLGLEFARQYAADGWRIIATCRDPARAEALRGLGDRVELHRLDVTDFPAVERLGEALRGETIDLLISDVVMPGMDGPTMVREARKTRPELPILFMSGYAEEQLRKSIDIANVAFLPKPFSVQELAEAVRKALSGN